MRDSGREKSWFEGDGGSEGVGSGATRTWPPPGAPPPRRPPPPADVSTNNKTDEALVVSTSTSWARPQRRHLVGFGLSVLRVVLLVGLCLGVLLRLLGLLVLLLVVHSLFFLFRNKYINEQRRWRETAR